MLVVVVPWLASWPSAQGQDRTVSCSAVVVKYIFSLPMNVSHFLVLTDCMHHLVFAAQLLYRVATNEWTPLSYKFDLFLNVLGKSNEVIS